VAPIRTGRRAFEAELRHFMEGGQPLSVVLESLVRTIERWSGDARLLGSVLLRDGNWLRHGAAPSLPAEYNAAIDGVGIGPSVGSCGTAAWCGHEIFVADIATDPLWKDFAELALKHGLRACWSVPILDERKNVLGTFALYYREPRSPSDAERALVRMAAEAARAVLASARQESSRTVGPDAGLSP
jgi:GAF domain-containing protein